MRTNQTILDSTTLTIELDGDNLVACVRAEGSERLDALEAKGAK